MSLTDSFSQSAASDPAVNSSSHRFGDPIVLIPTLLLPLATLWVTPSLWAGPKAAMAMAR